MIKQAGHVHSKRSQKQDKFSAPESIIGPLFHVHFMGKALGDNKTVTALLQLPN